MPPRSKIELLPEDVREELERRLIASGFGGYRGLADWLASRGFEISKSSLHEWGQGFEQRVAQLKLATNQARAIVEASPDDEGAVNEALQRLVQEKLFQALMAFDIDPEKASKINLGSFAKAVAELGRASVAQKKFMAEVKEKARATAEDVARSLKKGGLSDAQAEEIRNKILGITAATPKGE